MAKGYTETTKSEYALLASNLASLGMPTSIATEDYGGLTPLQFLQILRFRPSATVESLAETKLLVSFAILNGPTTIVGRVAADKE